MNELKFKSGGVDYLIKSDGTFKGDNNGEFDGVWASSPADAGNHLVLKSNGRDDVTIPINYEFNTLADPEIFNVLKVTVPAAEDPSKAFAYFGGTIKIGKNREIIYKLESGKSFVIHADMEFTSNYQELTITADGKRSGIIGTASLDPSKSAFEDERDLLQFITSSTWKEGDEPIERIAEIEFRGSLAVDTDGKINFIGSFEGKNTFNFVLAGHYKLGSVGLQIISEDGEAQVMLSTRGSFDYSGTTGDWDVGIGYSKRSGLTMKAEINFKSNDTPKDGSASFDGKAKVFYEKNKFKADLEFHGKFEVGLDRSLEFKVTGNLVDGVPSFGFAGTAIYSGNKLNWLLSHNGKQTSIALGYEGERLKAIVKILRGKSGIEGSFMISFVIGSDGRQKPGLAVPVQKAATGVPAPAAPVSPPLSVTVAPSFAAPMAYAPAVVVKEVTFPGDIRAGHEGGAAKRVQEWVTLHGFHTPVDSSFGPATRKAVSRFQAAKSLVANGVVDQITWDHLVAPLVGSMNAKASPGATLDQAVLEIAKAHLSNKPEEVGGKNQGPWVRAYCDGADGSAYLWCAGFVSFILHQASHIIGQNPPLEGDLSCDELAAQAKSAGRFLPGSAIESGKVPWSTLGKCGIFLKRKNDSDWTHTGFAFNGSSDVFETIEGNTSPELGSDDNRAYRGSRSFHKSYDFIRLA